MIRAFNELGKTYLKKVSDSDRKLEFLNGLTIEPKQEVLNKKWKKEKCYEIIFDFNLELDIFNIKLGKEIDLEKRKEYFGFKLPAANNSKLFLTSNNWNYHLLTISHSLKYLVDKKLDSTLSSYYELLSLLNKKFCNQRTLKDSKGKEKREKYFSLEKLSIKESQKIKKILIDEILNRVSKDIKGDKKNQESLIKNMEYKISSLDMGYQECLEKIFDFLKTLKETEVMEKINSDDKFFMKVIEKYIYSEVLKKDSMVLKNQNIYTITINGRRILDTEYRDEYIEFMYFALKERFFEKKELVDSTCGCCGKSGDKKEIKVTRKVDIPTKFYNTNQPSFFENLNEKSYHKALGLCEECFENIRVGIGRIHEEFKGSLFGTEYYLIPNSNFDDLKILKKIKRKLSNKSEIKTANDEVKKIKEVKRISDKNLDFGFNMLFWEKSQAEFIVIEELQNLSSLKIEKTFGELEKINNKDFYNELDNVGINILYYLLYPNKESHPKLKDMAKLSRKEALTLFSQTILNRRIDYRQLMNNFIDIYMKKYFKKDNKLKKDNYPLDALKMNIIISWINSVSNLEGGINLSEGQSYMEISNKDIKEFLNVHKDIYSNNYYRQGLVMLGYLINKVKYQQKGKNSSILDRLNYDGINPKRIKNLVADVVEMLKIYKEFDYNGKIFSEMMDRLQGIEDSKMNKDEVVFYILTGIGLGRYIGIKYSKVNIIENGGDSNE